MTEIDELFAMARQRRNADLPRPQRQACGQTPTPARPIPSVPALQQALADAVLDARQIWNEWETAGCPEELTGYLGYPRGWSVAMDEVARIATRLDTARWELACASYRWVHAPALHPAVRRAFAGIYEQYRPKPGTELACRPRGEVVAPRTVAEARLRERVAAYLEEYVGETGFPWDWVRDNPEHAAPWFDHADTLIAMIKEEK